MYANSSPVLSPQTGPHPRLADTVRKHRAHPFRRPPAAASRAAVEALCVTLRPTDRLVLDAGCGTGASTLALARLHPDAIVVGVDKSAARLATRMRAADAATTPANLRLVRCDLVDLWLLAAAAGLRFERQYLLYPNPWPKPEHLQRRWHGHAVLPALLACGGAIELRTNWAVYAQEFALALALCGRSATVEAFAPDPATATTPFERKYAASGHVLTRVLG